MLCVCRKEVAEEIGLAAETLFVKNVTKIARKAQIKGKKLGNFDKNAMIAKNLTISYTQIVFFVIQYVHLSGGQSEGLSEICTKVQRYIWNTPDAQYFFLGGH